LVVPSFIAALSPSSVFAQPERRIIENVGLDQHLDAQLPLDVLVRNEAGDAVPLSRYIHDKPVILNFVYYRCPMLCTQVLNGLLKSSQALKFTLGDEYEIVSISIDPRETPQMAAEKKARYVKSYRREGADKGWHFLTADEATIQRLTDIAGFRYQYDPASDQYAHASGIMLVTPDGRIARYFYGIDYHPTDLRLGLVETSQGKIGTSVDQVLLLCFHYDPKTGRYGIVISRVIQLAGIATILILGRYLWLMYRLEKSRLAAVGRASQPVH
jgi:protein SCO1/2